MKYIKTYTIKSIICTYIHVHTYIQAYIYIYICVCVCVCVCVSVLFLALPYILHIPSDILVLVKFFLHTCY